MKLDRQATFNKAWKHATKMKALAKHQEACMYRAPNGEKCLMGAFIPNKDYNPSMEGKPIAELIRLKYIQMPSLGVPDLDFLDDLQYQHDQCQDLEELLPNLRTFAEDSNLTIPE